MKKHLNYYRHLMLLLERGVEMADITFIVHSDWLKQIESLPIEMQDQIIADMVRHGCEIDMMHEDDCIVNSFVKGFQDRIDYSKDKYQAKVEAGNTSGRKKKVDDNLVREMALEGKTSQQIADALGVSKSTIDHSAGWKSRKQKETGFVF